MTDGAPQLPDGAELTEHGWRLDTPGRIDPRPSLHWSTGVVVLAALLVGGLVSPWLGACFLVFAAVTLNPRGGTPIHGLELHRGTFEIYGLPPIPLHQVAQPVASGGALDLTIDGVVRTLVFDEPALHGPLAARIASDLASHGTTGDVPAPMHALRELDA